MTIPEEIEQLKTKLAATTDERAQAEALLDLLCKYAAINSTEHQPYIDHLLQLAEKLNEPLYKAWGLYHSAILENNKEDYDKSLDLFHQAHELFKTEADRKGIESSLDAISKILLHRGNFQDALEILLVSLTDSQGQQENKKRLADLYNNLGCVQQTLGKYNEALQSHYASLKFREELDDKEDTAKSYNNIGIVLGNLGRYPEALKSYFESLKSMEGIDAKLFVSRVYNNIGNAYKHQGHFDEALKYHSDSLKIKEEKGDRQGIAFSYSNIGIIHQEQLRHAEALNNYLESLKIRQELNDKWGLTTCYNNIGNVYESLGNYTKALENHFASMQLSKEVGNQSGLAHSYHGIGSAFFLLKDYQDALKNFFEAKKQGEDSGFKEMVKSACQSLSRTYTATGDFENALKYYQKYHEVEKEMLGEESQKQFNNLSFMHGLEQKEKQLEIEQLQNQEKQKELEIQHLRNVELKREKDRSESLLLNILPSEVAEELKEKGTADARLFDDVTVLFTDFKSFTTVSERLTPQELVDELHTCFSAFDGIMGRYGIEKIKTVGDAYLAVSGLPQAHESHAENVLRAATEIRDYMLQRREKLGEKTFEIRIGVHSGSVVAGIVGVKKFAYDIWGDTVNTAARMEQNSEAGRINISQTTYELIKDTFTCQYRGEVEAKNKGKLKMYFVN